MATDENGTAQRLIELINQIETMRLTSRAFLALSISGFFAVIIFDGNLPSYILGWCLGILLAAAGAAINRLETERKQIAKDIWDKA